IQQKGDAEYTFDSDRGSLQSEICREGGEKGRECITLRMHSTRLFEAMQKRGFYCALPMDPSRTHIACKKIPQT
ncbi:hypothetical protein M405DRAFT_751364, partial [Rhizopogon salebrosus TDB-379]